MNKYNKDSRKDNYSIECDGSLKLRGLVVYGFFNKLGFSITGIICLCHSKPPAFVSTAPRVRLISIVVSMGSSFLIQVWHA